MWDTRQALGARRHGTLMCDAGRGAGQEARQAARSAAHPQTAASRYRDMGSAGANVQPRRAKGVLPWQRKACHGAQRYMPLQRTAYSL